LNLKITNHLNFLTRVLRDDVPEGIQLSNAECDQLISVCKSQGVSAIIYKKIEHLPCEGNAATKFKNSLNNEYKIQSLVNMLRQTEEARVLTELKNVDINPILLKGAGISQTHYPQAELRERTDCDLFINLNDIEKTRKLLSKQGYSLGRSTYRSHQFSVTSNPGRSIYVSFDIHWRISNAPQFAQTINYQEALLNSIPLSTPPRALVLNPQYALLLACMHRLGNSNHDKNMLKWIYDIHLLILNMPTRELELFTELANKKDLSTVCLDGFERTQELFHTIIPSSILSSLSQHAATAQKTNRFRKSQLGLIIDDLKLLPGWTAKYKLIIEHVFPDFEYLLSKYPNKGKAWIPLLWLHHLGSALYKRLTLR